MCSIFLRGKKKSMKIRENPFNPRYPRSHSHNTIKNINLPQSNSIFLNLNQSSSISKKTERLFLFSNLLLTKKPKKSQKPSKTPHFCQKKSTLPKIVLQSQKSTSKAKNGIYIAKNRIHIDRLPNRTHKKGHRIHKKPNRIHQNAHRTHKKPHRTQQKCNPIRQKSFSKSIIYPKISLFPYPTNKKPAPTQKK